MRLLHVLSLVCLVFLVSLEVSSFWDRKSRDALVEEAVCASEINAELLDSMIGSYLSLQEEVSSLSTVLDTLAAQVHFAHILYLADNRTRGDLVPPNNPPIKRE